MAAVRPHQLMEHLWRTTNTVLKVHHGCFINLCGCTTAIWVLRHPHFNTILHLNQLQFYLLNLKIMLEPFTGQTAKYGILDEISLVRDRFSWC